MTEVNTIIVDMATADSKAAAARAEEAAERAEQAALPSAEFIGSEIARPGSPANSVLGGSFVARRVHIEVCDGQSGMSGRGMDFSTFKDPAHARILQFPGRGSASHTLVPAVEPLTMHDTATGIGPALQFARNWIETLPADDVIIIVPNAHGGTPLSDNAALAWRWGVPGNLSAQAVALTLAAKAAALQAFPNATVTIDVVLWAQGEADGGAAVQTPFATYRDDLDALIAGYRTTYASPELPFIIYGMIPEALAVGTRQAIDAAHRNTPYRVPFTGFVPSIAGQNNGDLLHANAAQHRMNGPVALAEFKRVLSGRAATNTDAAFAAQVTGLNGSPGSNGTSVALTWAAAANAATYVVQYRTVGASSWSTFGSPVSSPAATVTGLTTGTAYEFRVIAQNAIGQAAPSATITRTPATWGGTAAGVAVQPLYAYSVARKVVSLYNGPAIRVQRSSDNTQTDIGFASNALDTTALLAFAGSGDAFVVKVYDQSGNSGYDVVAAAIANAPKIVNAGSLITSGGKPAALFDGADDVLSHATPGLYNAGAATVLGVLKSTGSISTALRWWAEANSTVSTGQYALQQSTSTSAKKSASVVEGLAVNTSNLDTFDGLIHQLAAQDSGVGVSTWVDGTVDQVLSYTRSTPANPKNTFALGGVLRSGTLSPLPMTWSEAVFWSTVLTSTDRQTGQSNQKAFYGTP